MAIREIRESQGITQEEAAFACDIDRAHYGHLERGDYAPTLATIWKIAGGLEIKPATVISQAERHMQNDV